MIRLPLSVAIADMVSRRLGFSSVQTAAVLGAFTACMYSGFCVACHEAVKGGRQ